MMCLSAANGLGEYLQTSYWLPVHKSLRRCRASSSRHFRPTAAEWRRAIDRLAHLNTVLSPSTKAAAAAAAAIKNALARVGALRKAGGPERTGSVGEDAANADSGREQQFAATAVSDDDIGGNGSGGGGSGGGGGGGGDEFVSSDRGWREERDAPSGGFRATATGAEAPTAVLEAEREAATRRGAAPASSSSSSSAADAAAAAARTGAAEVPAETERRADRGAEARTVPCADGAEEETDRKRNDLGRSVRDTALAMRGLARLYPLSQSFRWVYLSCMHQCVFLCLHFLLYLFFFGRRSFAERRQGGRRRWARAKTVNDKPNCFGGRA